MSSEFVVAQLSRHGRGDYIDLLKTHGIQITMSRRGKLARSRFPSTNPVLMGAFAIYLWTKR